jgi:hypothetical protein
MKQHLVIFTLMLAVAACNNNTNTKNGADNRLPASLVNNPLTANGLDTVAAARKPTMDFKDTLHDFGQVHEDEIVQYNFEFTNHGKNPLIITSAAGSCGCTVPDYPHDPIEPGKNGVLRVSFNSAGKSGHQEKSVSLHTNTLRGTEMLYIKAEVVKK